MQKNTFKHKHLVISYLLVTVLLTLTYSCKKEYQDFPYNEIEKFSIKDALGAELKATIHSTDIIIYWPPFQEQPDSIQPQISVSDRAVVTPLSNVKIPMKEGFSYEVKAQDGSTKTFTLKIANNQPLPYFEHAGTYALDYILSVSGDYFIPDAAKTSIFLIDKNKKETQLNINSITNSTIQAKVPMVLSHDTSHYQIKITTGKRTLTKGPVYIDRPALGFVNLSLPADLLTIKRGQTLIFSHTETPGTIKYYNLTNAYAAVAITNRVSRNVPIQITDTEIRLTIPQDFPLGKTYGLVVFNVEARDRGSWRRTASPFTVTE